MSKRLEAWIEEDVDSIRENPVKWLSSVYFFRDLPYPQYVDSSFFFSPASGILLYSKVVDPDERLVDIKGMDYTLRDALRDHSYDRASLVIGIFMTFYDVHVNRIPYSGRLTYQPLEPIDTHNHPMLETEKSILDKLHVPEGSTYLRQNQRVVNRIYVPELCMTYRVLQIADYDVCRIMPFDLRQHQPFTQGQRFSQIRYGSQVDLIVPVSDSYELTPLQEIGTHVEAGIDPLIRIR